MKFKARQDEIDAGTYQETGPGRRRNNGHLSTLELEVLVLDYLRDSIRE